MPSEEEFEEFWKLYPKKVAKGDARKAWNQTSKIRPSIAELLKSVYAARASKSWLRDDGEFIPYPATWLRQERWSDELEVDLSQMSSPKGKVCAYCGGVAVGMVNGRHACNNDWHRAMGNEKSTVVAIGSKADEIVDMKLKSCGQ